MYSTCLFCHSDLGRNEVVESFPVGRRLAFDGEKGRLWVICRRCSRWNLTPLDERWEALEDCERLFRGTRVRVSTDNIGLARLDDGLELVRIGRPLRPEFAAWRYGAQFNRRRQRAVAIGATGAAAAMVGAPVALAAVPVFGTVLFTGWVAPWLALPYTVARDYVVAERVVARVPTEEGVARVRVRHLRESSLIADGRDVAIDLAHDGGRTRVGGESAFRALGVFLAQANAFGGSRRQVSAAVERIGDAGDAATFLGAASRLSRRSGGRFLSKFRSVGALQLTDIERLALEMALHEESERRVLEVELTHLAEAWRDAEEIAAIADAMW